MKEEFIKRSKSKSRIAYLFLFVAMILILFGLLIVLYLFAQGSFAVAQAENDKEVISISYSSTLNVLIILTLIFFMSQTLLRNYRYNILKSDHYIACSEAIYLSTKEDRFSSLEFQRIMNILHSDKTELTNPDTPKLSIMNFGKKSS